MSFKTEPRKDDHKAKDVKAPVKQESKPAAAGYKAESKPVKK